MVNAQTPLLAILSLSLIALVSGGCRTGAAGGSKSALMAVSSFQNLPASADPTAVGEKSRTISPAGPCHQQGVRFIIYPEVCTAYGGLRFADTIGDAALKEQLVRRYDDIFPTEGNRLIPSANHVDSHVFGVVPLEIYLVHGGQKYLDLGQGIADKQWENPQPDGLTRETRYGLTTCS